MPKLQTLFVFAVALLFLLISLTCVAARTAPPEHAKSLQQYAAHHQEAEKVNFEESNMEEECGGVGEDECLIRRTLVAHTDYMYTKEKND